MAAAVIILLFLATAVTCFLVDSGPSWIAEEREKVWRKAIASFNAEGILMNLEKGQTLLQWSEIQTLIAYKEDLFTTDEVRLCIGTSDSKWYVAAEDMYGWPKMLEELQRRFPSIPVGWEHTIWQPAFDRNTTLLYDKQARALTEIVGE